MKNTLVVALVAALASTALLAVASPAQAATPKERNLARQVKTLKKQVKTLKTQNTTLKNSVKTLKTQNTTLTNERNGLAAEKTALGGQVNTLTVQVWTLTNERDGLKGQVTTLSGQLATAQQGAVATLGTMSESSLYFNVLPIIANVFNGGSSKYDQSFYSSGSDYSSRDFTFCGFC